VAVLERLGEPAAIGAGVDAEARRHRDARRAEDVRLDGGAPAQQVILKIPLDPREGAHEGAAAERRGPLAAAVERGPCTSPAALASVRAASSRASSSSAQSSASGGMWASRPLMVEPGPKRATA